MFETELIDKLRNSPEPGVRREAAEAIVLYRTPEIIDALVAALQDTNRGVRNAAANSLESIGNELVCAELVSCLQSPKFNVRNTASDLLIRLGLRAVPSLIQYLEFPDHDVRKFIVDIIGLIPNNSCDELIIPLLTDADSNVRISAVEALGNMKSLSAVPALIEHFTSEPDLQTTVIDALGKIGGEQTNQFLSDTLRTSLNVEEPDSLLIVSVVGALGECGDEQCADILCTLLHTAGDLREEVISAFLQICERFSLPTSDLREFTNDLLQMLGSGDQTKRHMAITAFCSFPESECAQTVVASALPDIEANQFIIDKLCAREGSESELITLLTNMDPNFSDEHIHVMVSVLREKLYILSECYSDGIPLLLETLQQLRDSVRQEVAFLIEDLCMTLEDAAL